MKNNNKTFQNYTLTSPVVMEIMFYLHVCAKDFANKMHRHITMLLKVRRMDVMARCFIDMLLIKFIKRCLFSFYL